MECRKGLGIVIGHDCGVNVVLGGAGGLIFLVFEDGYEIAVLWR